MGRYTLFDDFLIYGTASHFEVLEAMKNFNIVDGDDDRLLVPALFDLGTDRWQKAKDERLEKLRSQDPIEYELRTKIFPKNSLTQRRDIVRMFELTLLLRKLQGHNYNIYACSFLAISEFDEDCCLVFMASCSLIAQILLISILMYYNIRDIKNGDAKWSADWGTILVVIVTTAFFFKLVYKQWGNASDFNTVFWKAGFLSDIMNSAKMQIKRAQLKKALLVINNFVNGVLGIVIVLFNIFFLLISKSVNEAILNSLALYFILEIDDMMKPDWDEAFFDKRIALNTYQHIFERKVGDDVKGIRIDILPLNAQDDLLDLLKSDDKVCVEATKNGDRLSLTLYWRRSQGRYDKVEFNIKGDNVRAFFEDIEQFYCVQRDAAFVTIAD